MLAFHRATPLSFTIPAEGGAMPKINNIVLVHGGFVDGAGWRGVYDILKRGGFEVSIVQNPTISLAGDVGATKLVVDSQPGPRDTGWALLWRGHHYRSGHAPESRRIGVRHCVRPGQGRVR